MEHRMTRYGVIGKEGVVEWATSLEQAEKWAAYSGTQTSQTDYKNAEVVVR